MRQAMQADLSAVCAEGGGGVLHPRVVEYVLEGRPLRGPQGQAPLNQLLAFWRERGRQKGVSMVTQQ